jgi:hypothetical protein
METMMLGTCIMIMLQTGFSGELPLGVASRGHASYAFRVGYKAATGAQGCGLSHGFHAHATDDGWTAHDDQRRPGEKRDRTHACGRLHPQSYARPRYGEQVWHVEFRRSQGAVLAEEKKPGEFDATTSEVGAQTWRWMCRQDRGPSLRVAR